MQFVKETSAKTGRSKRSVKQDKSRGENIAKDVQKAIAGTDIQDSGVQLDALAKAPPDEKSYWQILPKRPATGPMQGKQNSIR